MKEKIFLSPIKTKKNDMVLSAPTTTHIELTSSCNEKCRHCYNFWRQYEGYTPKKVSKKQLDFILEEFKRNHVFHTIFTGGEPFLNFDNLVYGIREFSRAGISVSCNSNLLLATPERIRKLKEAGLEHILTTLNSYNATVNDFIVSTPGAYRKIITGIKNAVDNGIRISVNMIISQINLDHIYPTARTSTLLGAKKFHATRTVPLLSRPLDEQRELQISKENALIILEQLVKVKEDFGIDVGTLIPFPYCLYGDKLDTYKEIYSHGCPAGNKMMSLNANGDAHACVHEARNYGNIFEIGLKGVWDNMKEWRGDLFPKECKACSLFDICNGGCRIVGETYTGSLKAYDNLRVGWGGKPLKYDFLKNARRILGENRDKTLRMRREQGFYVVDKFGSEIFCVKNG